MAFQKEKVVNEIIISDTKPKECNHYFEFTADGCRCRKCNMGLKGVLQIKNGKPVL